MNLSIAAVIEGLDNAKSDSDAIINGDNLKTLLDAWMEYDPNATGWIKIEEFICLIIELEPPFGNKNLQNNFQCKYKKEFDDKRGK